jgi:hypothetical protein
MRLRLCFASARTPSALWLKARPGVRLWFRWSAGVSGLNTTPDIYLTSLAGAISALFGLALNVAGWQDEPNHRCDMTSPLALATGGSPYWFRAGVAATSTTLRAVRTPTRRRSTWIVIASIATAFRRF